MSTQTRAGAFPRVVSMRDYTLTGAGSPATPLLAMGFLTVKVAPHGTGASPVEGEETPECWQRAKHQG